MGAVRPSRPVLTALACLLGAAAPAAAQGPPSVTTGAPTVDGDYVTLSGSIGSSDNCVIGNGCPAWYIISAAPLPPTAGYNAGWLLWINAAQPQPLPFIVNMRSVREAFTFPPQTTTYTVALAAEYQPSGVEYGDAQTFTWPAGQLSLGSVDLVGGRSPRLAYGLRTGKTPFRSASVTATISTTAGRQLGSFRDRAEPGQNLARPPARLAARLEPGARYRVALRARDEFDRRARRSGVVRL